MLDPGVVERRVERGDLLGAHARVLVRVPEVQLGAQRAGRAVRALRVVGGQPAAVEAGERGDPVGMRGGDPQPKPRPHAVAGDGERLAGDLGQLVEVGGSVGSERLRRELLHQRPHLLEELSARLLAAHVRERQHRRPAGAVEDVRRQDGVAALGDPVGHLLDPRTQPVRIDQEEHAGMTSAVVRQRQVRVGDAIGRLDVHGLPGSAQLAVLTSAS